MIGNEPSLSPFEHLEHLASPIGRRCRIREISKYFEHPLDAMLKP